MGEKVDRYGIILSYLQYENTMYWTRINFFLLSNSALLGFVINSLPLFNSKISVNQIFIHLIASISGFILVILWNTAIKNGLYWINHWHSILLCLEEDAFKDIKVFRDQVDQAQIKDRRHKARDTAKYTLLLFLILLVLIFFYLLFLLFYKIIEKSIY